MKKWDLRGKRALITGGTKGIGRAIAEEFWSWGAEVIIVARNSKEVHETVHLWETEGTQAERRRWEWVQVETSERSSSGRAKFG